MRVRRTREFFLFGLGLRTGKTLRTEMFFFSRRSLRDFPLSSFPKPSRRSSKPECPAKEKPKQRKGRKRRQKRRRRRRRRRRKPLSPKKKATHRRRRRSRRSSFVVPAVEEPRHDRPRVVLAHGLGRGLPSCFCERGREGDGKRDNEREKSVQLFPLQKKPRPRDPEKEEEEKNKRTCGRDRQPVPEARPRCILGYFGVPAGLAQLAGFFVLFLFSREKEREFWSLTRKRSRLRATK